MRLDSRIAFIGHEVKATLERPQRVRLLLKDSRKRKVALNRLTRPVKAGDWQEHDGRFAQRTFGSYQDYVDHQASKLDIMAGGMGADYDVTFRETLRDRLRPQGDWKGKTVLCLAARTGAEVRAFLDLQAFAVGIDLNPGQGNRYVLVGDFHDLQFPDATVDVVYTNSLDHVLELDRLATEVRRVLRPDGVFIVEAGLGTAEGGKPSLWETMAWSRIDDLVGRLTSLGFGELRRQPITVPHEGAMVVLRAT